MSARVPAIPAVPTRESGRMSRIRVLIVDDHPVVRDGLRGMLSDEPELEVVGEAEDGEAALAAVEALDPTSC